MTTILLQDTDHERKHWRWFCRSFCHEHTDQLVLQCCLLFIFVIISSCIVEMTTIFIQDIPWTSAFALIPSNLVARSERAIIYLSLEHHQPCYCIIYLIVAVATIHIPATAFIYEHRRHGWEPGMAIFFALKNNLCVLAIVRKLWSYRFVNSRLSETTFACARVNDVELMCLWLTKESVKSCTLALPYVAIRSGWRTSCVSIEAKIV